MRHTLKTILIFTALVNMVGALNGCKKKENHQHDVATPVQVVLVHQGVVPETHHYSADLQPAATAVLRFRVSGYVRALREVRDTLSGRLRGLDIGDNVPQGGLLASLRKIDFTTQVDSAHEMTEGSRHTAQSVADQLQQSEAQLANDQANYIRAQRLYAAGAMTGQDFDRSKSQYESSLANRESTRKQLASREDTTRQSQSQEAARRLDLADADLKAPFPGTVLAKMIEIGDYTSSTQDAFRFGDIRVVKAIFNVAAIEVGQLHLGDDVDVHLPQSMGTSTKGKITLISSVGDQQSRLFRVEVSLPNPRKTLLVGTTGTLDLKTGLNLQKLSVPLTALVAANPATHGYTVFALHREDDHTVTKLRQVYLVSVAGDQAIIDGDLQANEQVVDRPSEQLRDGTTVVAEPGGAQ